MPERYSGKASSQSLPGGLRLYEPDREKARIMARLLWRDMDEKHRRQSLWDVPMAQREDSMASHFANAHYRAFCTVRAWIPALSYGRIKPGDSAEHGAHYGAHGPRNMKRGHMPENQYGGRSGGPGNMTGFVGEKILAGLFIIHKGGGMGAAHFAVARNHPGLEQAARLALAGAFASFGRLIACLPIHWRGARALAEKLGFVPVAVLKSHCWLAEHGRWLDGQFYELNRRDFLA